MRSRIAAIGLALGLGLGCLREARAEDVAAGKALFDRGLADMTAARYESGCPALAESYKLDPRPGTLFTLAECEAKRGRTATAVELYDDYLSQLARLSPDKQKQQGRRREIAQEQRITLAPQVARLTLLLAPDAVTGTTVKRNGRDVAPAAIGLALPVDPGEQIVTLTEPGRPPFEVRLTVGPRQKRLVTLPRPPAAPFFTPRVVGATVAGGVGVVGLLVGIGTGAATLAKKSTINAHCNFPGDPYGCDPTGLAATSSAKTLSVASTVGFVVGALGVGTGLVVFLTDPNRDAAKKQGLAPAWTLTAGRDGSTVGLAGVF